MTKRTPREYSEAVEDCLKSTTIRSGKRLNVSKYKDHRGREITEEARQLTTADCEQHLEIECIVRGLSFPRMFKLATGRNLNDPNE